jgi:hypothetical protein
MEDQSIKSLFSLAERKRNAVETSWDSSSSIYRENLAAAIATYEECRVLADRLSLFSPNETLEDITSGDLQLVQTFQAMPYVLTNVDIFSSTTIWEIFSSESQTQTEHHNFKRHERHMNDT